MAKIIKTKQKQKQNVAKQVINFAAQCLLCNEISSAGLCMA